MRCIISLVILVLFSGYGHTATLFARVDTAIGKPGNDNGVMREIKLTQVDNMFLPAEIVVQEGEKIRLVIKNGGNHTHEMLIGLMTDLKKAASMRRMNPDIPHAEANLIRLEPGKQKELIWQFTQAGVVDFACPLPGHFKKMRGKFFVEKK